MFLECKYYIFDLDGTITDPEVGITTCAKFALREMGYEKEARQDLRWMIGPPLADSFKKITGCDDTEAQKLVNKYRERYSVKGVHENTLYQGITEVLDYIKSIGGMLVIASSKPTEFVEQILKDFNIRKYFDIVQGSDMAGKHVEKTAVLKIALSRINIINDIDAEKNKMKADINDIDAEKNKMNADIKELEKAVMIGDRKYDIAAAKMMGIKSIAVRYGYATQGEWENLIPDKFANTTQELLEILKK